MLNNIKIENEITSIDFGSHKDFVITKISGLEPPDSNIITREAGNGIGAVYNSSSVDKRNIVFNISIMNNVEANINLLASIFIPSQKIDMTFKNKYHISGYVETFDINNFQMLTTLSISVLCPDPLFYGSDKIYENITSEVISIDSYGKNYNLKIEAVINTTGNNSIMISNSKGTTLFIDFYNTESGKLTIDCNNRTIYFKPFAIKPDYDGNLYGNKTGSWVYLLHGDNTLSISGLNSNTVTIKDYYYTIY